MLKTVRYVSSIILLAVSIFTLVWAELPNQRQAVSQFVEPTEMQVPNTGSGVVPTVLEIRQIRLEWPKFMRIGDSGFVTLVFEPVKSEIIAPKPQAELTNVYEGYNLMAEGRLDVAGMQVSPANPRRASMPPGQNVSFKWTIRPSKAVTYPGEMWLSIRFLPLDGGEAIPVPIFVQGVNIHASSLLGLSGPQARLFGGLGSMIGLVLSYDVMIGVVKKVIKKITKKDHP